MVKREAAEHCTDKYHYLGLVIDYKHIWHENTFEIIKKVPSHLFCLRKLKSFRIHEDILKFLVVVFCPP